MQAIVNGAEVDRVALDEVQCVAAEREAGDGRAAFPDDVYVDQAAAATAAGPKGDSIRDFAGGGEVVQMCPAATGHDPRAVTRTQFEIRPRAGDVQAAGRGRIVVGN